MPLSSEDQESLLESEEEPGFFDGGGAWRNFFSEDDSKDVQRIEICFSLLARFFDGSGFSETKHKAKAPLEITFGMKG